MRLVLASTSPRRRELLALLGLSFDLRSPVFDERPTAGLSPREQVARFALGKAKSVAVVQPQDVVIGSDTVIDLDGRLMGKPADLADARAMLTSLAGRSHDVHSAVALCCRARNVEIVEVATATVYMKAGIEEAIKEYLESRESLGKAGAYSIQGQGGDLIARIDGDYTTVVGFPVEVAARLLKSVGYVIPRDVDALYRHRPYPNWSRFAV